MNYESLDNRPLDGPSPQDEAAVPGTEPVAELLGAADIVEAFTALRHELKLQVRGGRDLQQSLAESLQRIEQRMISQQAQAGFSSGSSEGRQLAEAVAEMEESLERVLTSTIPQVPPAGVAASLLDQYDQAVTRSGWIVRKLAGKLLQDLRAVVEQLVVESEQLNETFQFTCQGLELLHARVLRLMQQCDIRRVDVLYEPFDAETMHAIDRIDAPSVPSSHVAEQLRPAYLWRGVPLRFADVRLAR